MPKNNIDKIITKLLNLLERKYRIYLNSSQSKWGAISILFAVSFFCLAVSPSLYALCISYTSIWGSKMNFFVTTGFYIFAILFLIAGIMGVVGILLLGKYFLQYRQNETSTEDSLEKISNGVNETIPQAIKQSSQNIIQEIGAKIDNISENRDN